MRQERVEEEWSLVETLRHLVFVTDAWFGRAVLGREHPYHPFGLVPAFLRDGSRLGLDPSAAPSFAEVLAVREARVERGGGPTWTPWARTSGGGRCRGDDDRGYPPPTTHTVLECLHVVMDEGVVPPPDRGLGDLANPLPPEPTASGPIDPAVKSAGRVRAMAADLLREQRRFESVAAVREGLQRRDLPRRRGHRRGRVPGRPAAEADPGRGSGRHRQDPAGQVGGRDDRRPAHPPAVLRGPRRVQGALRVELQEAAPAHPGRAPERRRGTRSRTTSSPTSSCSPGRCSRPSAPRTRSCC